MMKRLTTANIKRYSGKTEIEKVRLIKVKKLREQASMQAFATTLM